MCTFHSISTFREQLNDLTKKEKDGYTSVWKDICEELANKTIDELRITPALIKSSPDIKIIKARIENSFLGYGKKDGYRLIYLARLDKAEIILLYVFPKRGRKGAVNVTDSAYVDFLETYLKEKKSDSLVSYNIK